MNLVAYLAQGQHTGANEAHPLHAAIREAPTAEALGRAAQALMLSFLLSSGGACRHPLVLDPEPLSGQDESSDATIQDMTLWDAAAHIPLQLGSRASHLLQCLQDAFRQDLRIRLPGPHLGGGEPFLYHALYLRICEDSRLRYFASALRRASPLTRLCHCPVVDEHPLVSCAEDQQGRPALTREESEGLSNHPAMTFLRGYVADQWSAIDAPQSALPPSSQIERLNARYATIAQALTSCISQGQLALLALFPLFFERLLQRQFQRNALASLQLSQWRLSDREALLRSYMGLLELGAVFEEHFQREVVQPGIYGWRRPAQTRAFVRTYGRRWSSGGLGTQIHTMLRDLRGQMG